jgi:hypothetical protein
VAGDIPPLILPAEIADVTENMLKPSGAFSLPKLLSDPAIQPYFRSLSITDQPSARPEGPLKPDARQRLVILSLAVPPVAAAGATLALVAGVFQLVDALAGAGPGAKPLLGALRPETRTKLRKRREELAADLQRDAEREAKEAEREAKEDALAAKRKAEKERIATLSAAEQQKVSLSTLWMSHRLTVLQYADRERKKAQKKAQGKAMVK